MKVPDLLLDGVELVLAQFDLELFERLVVVFLLRATPFSIISFGIRFAETQ